MVILPNLGQKLSRQKKGKTFQRIQPVCPRTRINDQKDLELIFKILDLDEFTRLNELTRVTAQHKKRRGLKFLQDFYLILIQNNMFNAR